MNDIPYIASIVFTTLLVSLVILTIVLNHKKCRYHFGKIPRVTMHYITSRYYHTIGEDYSVSQKRMITQGFEDGYHQALRDIGVPEEKHPKGRREK